MAHDIIERIAQIIAPEDFSLLGKIRAGEFGGSDAVRDRTLARLERPLNNDREKALEVLVALRDVSGGEDLPRHRSGEWRRENIEAFVNDVIGKPAG